MMRASDLSRKSKSLLIRRFGFTGVIGGVQEVMPCPA